jgi:predicted phosphodiesterase
MRDIRDSIRDAIDRTTSELQSKPQPVKQAFAMKSVGHSAKPGIEQLLADAKAAVAKIKDEDIHDGIIHVSDPNAALLLSVLESAPETAAKDMPSIATQGGAIIGVHKYDQTDPRWILSALNMLVSDKVPFPQPSGPNDQEVPLPDQDLTMAIAGDWGTGLYSSNQIASWMASHHPDLTLHIGDVYYSGTPEEIKKKFIGRFPTGKLGSYALNSNHEMYCGGHGYFGVTLKDPEFAHQKGKSFFSLHNKTWQIIALDTAYESHEAQLYQNGVLGQPQLDWFTAQLQKAKAAGRKVVLFTHHNPISVNGGTQDTGMMNQIFGAANKAGNMADYWFFGHEHAVAVFEPMQWQFKMVKPRVIGHGGIPYVPSKNGDKGNGVKVTWTETEHYAVGKGDPTCGLNGFGMLTFPLAGGDIVENYYDDSNRLRYTCGVAAKIAIGKQPQATA